MVAAAGYHLPRAFKPGVRPDTDGTSTPLGTPLDKRASHVKRRSAVFVRILTTAKQRGRGPMMTVLGAGDNVGTSRDCVEGSGTALAGARTMSRGPGTALVMGYPAGGRLYVAATVTIHSRRCLARAE